MSWEKLFAQADRRTFELSEYMLAVLILLGTAYTQQIKAT